MNKKNILLLLIPVLVLAVAVPCIIFSIIKSNADKAVAAIVTHSSSINNMNDGETTNQLATSDKTQVDSADKFTLFENPSEQVAKEINDDLMLLASSESFLYTGGGLGNGPIGIATCICQGTVDMNNFIDSYLGWPVSDEYPDSEYADARLYLAQLIVSMDRTTKMPENIYPEISAITQMSIIQYSIATGNQCIIDDNSGIYMETLYGYMKIGHPKITTINSMVLSVDDNKEFDGVKSDLQATIETDTGKYFVYLIYEQLIDKPEGFRILDIVKLS